MKKMICTLLVFTMFMVSAVSVNAAVVSDSLIGSPEYRNVADTFSCIEQIEKNCIESYGKNENNEEKYTGLRFAPELAFKVYEYTQSSGDFQKDGNISIVEEERYLWRIPIKNSKGDIVIIASFAETGEKWQLAYYGPASNTEIDYLTDKSSAAQLGMKIDVSDEDFKGAKTVFLSRYYITALYVQSEKEEYIIPIETIESLTPDLVKYKKYSVDEFTKNLSDADYLMNDKDLAEMNAGAMNSADTSNALAVTAAVIALCVIVAAGTVLAVVLRNKGADNN